MANSVLGGLASVAGGGKFANAAVTGAFGYLFNACAKGPVSCAPKSTGALDDVPESLRLSIDRVGAMIDRLGDATLMDRFDAWQISYKDVLNSGNVFAATNYSTQSTEFQKNITSLNPDEMDFAVAHEFGHLTPENHALGPQTFADAFRNPLGFPPQENNADVWARRILRTDANPGRFYGDYGNRRF